MKLVLVCLTAVAPCDGFTPLARGGPAPALRVTGGQRIAPPHAAPSRMSADGANGGPPPAVVVTLGALAAVWGTALLGGDGAASAADAIAGAAGAGLADEIYLDAPAGGITPLQYTALAVTALSILPTPGMVGMGGDDVRKGEAKSFGFDSVDDVVRAARAASSDKPSRGGRPRILVSTGRLAASAAAQPLAAARLAALRTRPLVMEEAPFWENVLRFCRFGITAGTGLIAGLLAPFGAFLRTPTLMAIGSVLLVGVLAATYLTLSAMQGGGELPVAQQYLSPTAQQLREVPADPNMQKMMQEIYGPL